MGLFTGLIGLAYLKQRQLDLEFKIQDVMISMNQVSNYSLEIVSIGDELDPESPEFKKLNTRRKKLQLMEKRLQAELVRYENELKLVNRQIDSMQKIVDMSIQRLTSFGGGGGQGYG